MGFLGKQYEKVIDLYLHQQGLDTTTPAGRAMFGMLGVFAEFERSMIQERVRTGLEWARWPGKGRSPIRYAETSGIGERTYQISTMISLVDRFGCRQAGVQDRERIPQQLSASSATKRRALASVRVWEPSRAGLNWRSRAVLSSR